ncbi:formyltransferase family protein [Sulfurimonas sp.]
MKKLKVVVLGEKPQGVRWLTYLIESNLFEIIAGVGRKEFKNAWWGKDNFEEVLTQNNIPVVELSELVHMDYDIIWSLMYGFKIPKELLKKAHYMGLNLHETPLPDYKGCNGVTLSILEGDMNYGTTFQQLSEDIDEGDIFDQELFEVGNKMTAKELYNFTQEISDKLFIKNMINVSQKSLHKIKENPRTEFNSRGSILPLKVLNFQNINNDFDKLYRYVRGFDFVPFEPAYFQYLGKKFYFIINASQERKEHTDIIECNIVFDKSIDEIMAENKDKKCFKITKEDKEILVVYEDIYKQEYSIFKNKKYLREINFLKNSKKRASDERLDVLNKDIEVTDDYKTFGKDYFDNKDLLIGYGGYFYDGRYAEVAKKIVDFYGLKKGSKVLEIGPAKGYLLVEFHKLGLDVYGYEKSEYAREEAHEEIKDKMIDADIKNLEQFSDAYFDLVISKEVLPHIEKENLKELLKELKRVGSYNYFLEIQVAGSSEAQEYVNKWDPTHKIIEDEQFWNNFLIENGYSGDVYYKHLF